MRKRLSTLRPSSAALLLSLLVLLFAAPAAQGQELPEFNLYGGLSAPTGDFADDSGSDAGFASFGFGVMGELVYPLGTPGLGWASSASLLLNSVDEELFSGADGVDTETGFYWNVPIMTGLRYRTELSPTLDGYALGQLGLNVTRPPSGELSQGDASIDYEPGGFGTTFGFALGAGIALNDQINITARYLRLGEPELEYDVEGSEGTSGEIEFEPSIGVVQIMVGFTL